MKESGSNDTERHARGTRAHDSEGANGDSMGSVLEGKSAVAEPAGLGNVLMDDEGAVVRETGADYPAVGQGRGRDGDAGRRAGGSDSGALEAGQAGTEANGQKSETHKPPSQRTVFAHADLELRRRFANRDARDHGKQTAAHGFHYAHHAHDADYVKPISRKSLEKVCCYCHFCVYYIY